MSTLPPPARQYSDAHILSAVLAVNRASHRDTREGWADLPSPGVDLSNPFLAGSQAKMYTAACIALLVKSNAIALSDPVRRFIPSCPVGVDVIGLLTHTSGLGDHVAASLRLGGIMGDGDQSYAGLVALAQRDTTSRSRGVFAYSNTGYLVLAMLVECVSGESLATFAAKRIFEPLGMQHTRFIDSGTTDAQPLLRRLDQQLVADGCLPLSAARFMALAHGSGNLITTIDDSLLFGRALLSGIGVPEIQLADLQQRGLECVVVDSHRLCGHRAHFLAVSSGTLVEPATGTTAAYLVEHRCPRDLIPCRDLLLYCEWLATRAFRDEEAV